MPYNFQEIERRIKVFWDEQQVYHIDKDSKRPKYYVLDMFPYPSGAGLHVGHPLGYIASDIYARYKRMEGFQVLHPMGFDAFGLPAEQYALETGQHPAVTTEKNINRYKEQLRNIGFSYDWNREICTSEPSYYQWTQWIFLKLFKSWFNRAKQKAEPIETLIAIFEKEGNYQHPAPEEDLGIFSKDDWHQMSCCRQREILMHYRLAYLDYAVVWWCEALGTVLANDEVINGFSERGGFPAERKRMRQWFLRITEFADRLLEGLETLDWTEAMKEMQKNWIGRSHGASISFRILNHDEQIEVFTTRPDTIFGVDFLVLAPEHPLVAVLMDTKQKEAVEQYVTYVKSRSELERMQEKKITGCFTGAYALHPFSGRTIPIWISEYVLAGYGTGAIMAVPSGDDRDFAFAKHFQLPITNIFGNRFTDEAAVSAQDITLENSDFLSGLTVPKATEEVLKQIELKKIGYSKVNYKMRDAGFSRQRYWGEPFPIVYKEDIPYAIDEPELDLPETLTKLPVTLPHVDHYSPGPEGEGPLANIKEWVFIRNKQGELLKRETNTMPGYAGSSWYFLRYMDPHNTENFADRSLSDYWQQVDLYVGGTEHAVGHLLYSRMWTKALHDLGYISKDEPFRKLLNQGMIQGSSRFIYRLSGTHKLISKGLITETMQVDQLHVDISLVNGLELDIERFKKWKNGQFADAEFLFENGKYYCGSEVEKMSKSKYNVVNPDHIVQRYGADTFRMYEMFLGPIEISKPWDTKGIEGVHRFLKKLWRLFYEEKQEGDLAQLVVTEEAANPEELKILHKTIKKVKEDTERFSFNTAVSQFMIVVNELSDLNCHKKEILKPLLLLLSPYAPHISEALWQAIGGQGSIVQAAMPIFKEEYVKEHSKQYPIAINGKTRTQIEIALEADQETIESIVLADPTIQKWMEGKPAKKIIYVKGRMINIVI